MLKGERVDMDSWLNCFVPFYHLHISTAICS